MVTLKLFLLVLGLLSIGFIGLAIKIWAKTDGKFDGTCASQNPTINPEGDACNFCGRVPDERTKVSNFVKKFKPSKTIS